MEGIWYAHFKSGEVFGDGVAVLHDGQIEGGDPVAHVLRFVSGRWLSCICEHSRESFCGLIITS